MAKPARKTPTAPAKVQAPAKTPLEMAQDAAKKGDANAQTHLGDDYLLGAEGLPKDVVQARHWYELAAQQGQPNAAFVLGEIYWNGDGTPKDNAAAAKWWKLAYDKGRDDAAKLLGDEAFARAQGPNRSWSLPALQEALNWYEKDAAIAGPIPWTVVPKPALSSDRTRSSASCRVTSPESAPARTAAPMPSPVSASRLHYAAIHSTCGAICATAARRNRR